MPQDPAARLSIDIPTGHLRLTAENDGDIAGLCDVAARRNPKRGFLIVSRILGRHLPAHPAQMRGSMDRLGAMLPCDLPEPIVFLGMAETATALGQGVFAAYRRLHPDRKALYLQTSRQRAKGSRVIASFEEGHSHATTHLVQVVDDDLAVDAAAARTLVIIDDECSTGDTFVAAAQAMHAAMPKLARVETCCITDWSGKDYLARMPLPTNGRAMLDGRLDWTPRTDIAAQPLASGSNRPGEAPDRGMRSRTGIRDPEQAIRAPLAVDRGERILVLGEGEHSYEALRVAEEIERQGGHAAVQCITRSPAMLGHAMRSVSRFTDAYGSGAPCFLYNMLLHEPDRVMIVSEIEGDQVADAIAALTELGSAIPVDHIRCVYDAEVAGR